MRNLLARSRAASSTVAIATATLVIVMAALLSFADAPAERGGHWRLRGSIAPNAGLALPATPKRV